MRKIKPTPLLSLRDSNVYLFNGNMAVNGKLYKANGDVEDYPIPFVDTSFNWNSNKLQSSASGRGPLFISDSGTNADTSKYSSSGIQVRELMREGYRQFYNFGMNNKKPLVYRNIDGEILASHPIGMIELGENSVTIIESSNTVLNSNTRSLSGVTTVPNTASILVETTEHYICLIASSGHGVANANNANLVKVSKDFSSRVQIIDVPGFSTQPSILELHKVSDMYVTVSESYINSTWGNFTTADFYRGGRIKVDLWDSEFTHVSEVYVTFLPFYGYWDRIPRTTAISSGTGDGRVECFRVRPVFTFGERDGLVFMSCLELRNKAFVSEAQRYEGLDVTYIEVDKLSGQRYVYGSELTENDIPAEIDVEESFSYGRPIKTYGQVNDSAVDNNRVGAFSFHITNLYEIESKIYVSLIAAPTGWITRNPLSNYPMNTIEFTVELDLVEADGIMDPVITRQIPQSEFISSYDLLEKLGCDMESPLITTTNVTQAISWAEYLHYGKLLRLPSFRLTSNLSYDDLTNLGIFGNNGKVIEIEGEYWRLISCMSNNYHEDEFSQLLNNVWFSSLTGTPFVNNDTNYFYTENESGYRRASEANIISTNGLSGWTAYPPSTKSPAVGFMCALVRVPKNEAKIVGKRVRRGVFGMQGQSLYTYAEHEGTLYCITDDYIVPVKFDPVTKLHEIAGPLIDVNAVSIHISESGDLRIVDADFKLYHMKANQSDTVRLKANDITFDGEEHEGSIEVSSVNYKGEMIQARVELALSGPVKFENGSNRILIITNDSEPVIVPIIVTDYGSIDITASSVT